MLGLLSCDYQSPVEQPVPTFTGVQVRVISPFSFRLIVNVAPSVPLAVTS
jgi:hypothetical protein